MLSDFVYLASQQQFENFLDLIADEKVIGLDTEFERRVTYFPKPALLQIRAKHTNYLIDITVLENLDRLFLLLAGKDLLMHACREDLEVFRCLSIHARNLLPVKDMQIAASLLGFDTQISYQNLVTELLGVKLLKGETCSDWLQRPLSEAQLHYAADDVFYLHNLWDELNKRLQAKGRLSWFEEDCKQLNILLTTISAQDEYFYRMKGTGKLNEAGLRLAYSLVLWREARAIEKNLPRGFILKDQDILTLAKMKHLPENKSELASVKDLSHITIKKYADIILDFCAQATSKKSFLPIMENEIPVSSKAFKNEIKLFRDELAKSLEIKPEVLLSNRLMNQYFQKAYFSSPQERDAVLSGWRKDLFNEQLSILCQKHIG